MNRTLTVLTCAALAAVLMSAPPPAAAADDDAGWVKLFNGKDLTGWKTHPDDKAKWEVVDGAIVGTGPPGHLFSERGDYENFRFRVTAKIRDKGNSGQFFRAQFGKSFPKGYEAQINATGRDPIKTGSLYPAGTLSKYRDKILILDKAPHAPDEFFTQEVEAIGNHIVIRVNGKVTVDFVDPDKTFLKGHFAIQQHDPGSMVTVKSIEVKELPKE
jgi:hypothetical protein